MKKEKASGKSYYYLYNGHGDVVMMVDTNGTIVNQYQYDEWGNLLVNQETVQNMLQPVGKSFNPNARIGEIQIGVNPNDLTPSRNMMELSKLPDYKKASSLYFVA